MSAGATIPVAPSAGSSATAAPVVAPRPQAATPAVPDPVYTTTLLSWLDRHKEYAWIARRRHVGGKVALQLAVNAQPRGLAAGCGDS